MADTPEDAQAYLNRVTLRIPEMVRFALEATGANLQGNIRERVFPSGVQAADANGQVVKNGEPYSVSYAAFRKKKGRQVQNIDLQLTDELRKSYDGAVTDNTYTVLFKSSAQADKAEKLERLYRQEIFAASTTEADQAFDDFERLFFQQLDQIQ